MHDAFLGSHQGKDHCLRVQLHSVSALTESGYRLAEGGNTLVVLIAMTSRFARRTFQRIDGCLGRRKVRASNAKVDHRGSLGIKLPYFGQLATEVILFYAFYSLCKPDHDSVVFNLSLLVFSQN